MLSGLIWARWCSTWPFTFFCHEYKLGEFVFSLIFVISYKVGMDKLVDALSVFTFTSSLCFLSSYPLKCVWYVFVLMCSSPRSNASLSICEFCWERMHWVWSSMKNWRLWMYLTFNVANQMIARMRGKWSNSIAMISVRLSKPRRHLRGWLNWL